LSTTESLKNGTSYPAGINTCTSNLAVPCIYTFLSVKLHGGWTTVAAIADRLAHKQEVLTQILC